jgi:GNAT superfamily N-acetyltransferase
MISQTRGAYTLSTDPARVQVEVVHAFLRESYWAKDIPREIVERSIAGSLVFGIYHDESGQIAFARVISDRATFAYLADVFVLPDHRGAGLSSWMMEAIGAHPELQGLRRWMLVTRDAHGLYRRFGYDQLSAPERVMEKTDPQLYSRLRGPPPAASR